MSTEIRNREAINVAKASLLENYFDVPKPTEDEMAFWGPAVFGLTEIPGTPDDKKLFDFAQRDGFAFKVLRHHILRLLQSRTPMSPTLQDATVWLLINPTPPKNVRRVKPDKDHRNYAIFWAVRLVAKKFNLHQTRNAARHRDPSKAPDLSTPLSACAAVQIALEEINRGVNLSEGGVERVFKQFPKRLKGLAEGMSNPAFW